MGNVDWKKAKSENEIEGHKKFRAQLERENVTENLKKIDFLGSFIPFHLKSILNIHF